MSERYKNRRTFMKLVSLGTIFGVFNRYVPKPWREQMEIPVWPTDKEGILNKMENLNLPTGSESSTTFHLGKISYEMAMMMEREGIWGGGEKSDWINNKQNKENIKSAISILAESGFKRVRLVIPPFDLTEDGKDYKWEPVETILEMFKDQEMHADVCLGPLDYPYGPEGIRVPKKYQDLLNQQLQNKEDIIEISLGEDPNYPELSAKIRDYALDFYDKFLEKFGKDPRIGKWFLSNEWPDKKFIEGANGIMKVNLDFMKELIKRGLKGTDKKIALNTNIHPSDLYLMEKSGLAELIDDLGDKGELGLDTYYTEEIKDNRLAGEIRRYGEHVDALRARFPKTEIIFVELQGEPWPGELSGKPWSEIIDDHSEVVTSYYQGVFPPTLETYLQASKIKEAGLWGAPLWIIAKLMGYEFPLDMMDKLAQVMHKNKQK